MSLESRIEALEKGTGAGAPVFEVAENSEEAKRRASRYSQETNVMIVITGIGRAPNDAIPLLL